MECRAGHRVVLILALASLLATAGCTLPGTARPTAVPTQTAVPPTATATATPSPTPTATPPPTPTPVLNQTPQEIYRRVGPAVVTIVNVFTQNGRRARSFGSGVIFDRRGYIITNNHVIEDQQRLEVIFSDGVRRDAQLVGADPATDLAVLRVEGELPGVAAFGDSAKLEPGQPVVAIGSALGEFTNTVTTGIISGLRRDLPDRQRGIRLEGLIQTDSAINPGNSGGPLLNLQGEIIGINTAVIRSSGQGRESSPVEGLGFAVPSNVAALVSERIIAEGRVARPDLGTTTTPVTPGVAAQFGLQVQQGALVEALTAGSPAAAAGIQTGDIIIAVEGKPVNADNSLAFVLLSFRPGDRVTVTVARGQERFNAQVTLAGAP